MSIYISNKLVNTVISDNTVIQKMSNTNLINPKAIQITRKKMGLTQQQLADAINCTKDTVSRWERGKCRKVRSHLRDPLCRTLRTNWEKLTGPNDQPEISSMPSGWTKIPVEERVRAALQLTALRYDIRPRNILNLAPLLLVIVAERSLLWRKRRLDEINSVLKEADQKMMDCGTGHLGGIIFARHMSADDRLNEEQESLEKRDVFGRSFDYGEFWHEDDEGPFLHYIRELVKDLPDGAVTSIMPSCDGNMIYDYEIADDTLEQETGLSGEDEQGRKIVDYIRDGLIDLRKCIRFRQNNNEPDYQQWLSDELERADEERRQELLEIFGPDGIAQIAPTLAGGRDASPAEVER